MRTLAPIASVLLLNLLPIASPAQQPAIDPFWIYSTPPSWHRFSADQFGTDPLNLVLLTPDGEYAEVRATLLRTGKHGIPHLELSSLAVSRLGRWSKTDDNAVRFTTHATAPAASQATFYENAQLQGRSSYRIAAAIISSRQRLVPLPDLADPKDLRMAIDSTKPQP